MSQITGLPFSYVMWEMGFGMKPFSLPNNLENFEQVRFHIKLSFSYTYKCLTMATSDCVRMRQSSKGTHIEVAILHYCESIQAALNEHSCNWGFIVSLKDFWAVCLQQIVWRVYSISLAYVVRWVNSNQTEELTWEKWVWLSCLSSSLEEMTSKCIWSLKYKQIKLTLESLELVTLLTLYCEPTQKDSYRNITI